MFLHRRCEEIGLNIHLPSYLQTSRLFHSERNDYIWYGFSIDWMRVVFVIVSDLSWNRFCIFLSHIEEFHDFLQQKVSFYNKKAPFLLARLLLQYFPHKEEDIFSCIKAATHMPEAYLPLFPPISEFKELFPYKSMIDMDIVPLLFSSEENKLVIALFDPFLPKNIITKLDLHKFDIVAFLAPLTRIRTSIERLRFSLKLKESSSLSSNDAVKFVDCILHEAVEKQASDIHIEQLSDWSRVRFRVDGFCHTEYVFSSSFHSTVISRIKVMSSMDISDKRRPQDGRFCLQKKQSPLDVRVASIPTLYGEKVVLRLLGSSYIPTNIDQLGLKEEVMTLIFKLLSKREGLLLVTGPTGSGKTTTLHALIDEIDADSLNVTTIEDPIERTHWGVNQIQVDEKAGRSFNVVLRALLRQDPDVILVGEIRDTETAHLAVRAALTGHLVLSTLHTEDAASAPLRLMEMGVPPFLVVSALKAVISQRLVRRVCPHCKNNVESNKSLIGCPSCGGTGFSGRIGVFECLYVSNAIRKLLFQETPVQFIREQAHKEGMESLLEDGIQKVRKGLTTMKEIASLSSDMPMPNEVLN